MAKSETLRELIELIRERKKWFLIPVVAVLALVALIVVSAQGSVLAPFIYALF